MNTNSSSVDSNSLGYYFFQFIPQIIVREVIFREMLELKDIARLEVAAAVYSIFESQEYLVYFAMLS
jgi:hypothetical protein